MQTKISKLFIVGALVALINPSSAWSLSLDDSATERVTSTSFGTSYDESRGFGNYDFSTLSGGTSDGALSTSFFQLGSLSGGDLGANLKYTSLAELTCYDGTEIAGLANALKLRNDKTGEVITLFDSASKTAGDTGEVFLEANSSWTLFLDSPDGEFSSKDSENGGETRMIAQRIDKTQAISIDAANLQGLAISAILPEGGYILAWEDLKSTIIGTDWDYQDQIGILQLTAVPEPATAILFGMGLLGMGARRRKRSI